MTIVLLCLRTSCKVQLQTALVAQACKHIPSIYASGTSETLVETECKFLADTNHCVGANGSSTGSHLKNLDGWLVDSTNDSPPCIYDVPDSSHHNGSSSGIKTWNMAPSDLGKQLDYFTWISYNMVARVVNSLHQSLLHVAHILSS